MNHVQYVHVDNIKVNLYVQGNLEKVQTEKTILNKSPSVSLNQSLKNQSVITVSMPAAGITK